MNARPVVITSDELVLDDLLRITAAAAVEVMHSPEPVLRSTWRSAPLVVIDSAMVERILAAGFPRRPGVVVVASSEPDALLWDQCIRLGVERTVLLAEGEEFLIDRLADSVAGDPGDGCSVALISACGGAGASVLSTAVAIGAQRVGRSVLLADCDQWGAGLDVILGVEAKGGVRWTDLAAPAGRLPADALHQALPRLTVGRGQLPVLCHDRNSPAEVSPELIDVVLETGRRAGDVTIVDLPRYPTAASERVVERADLTVLVMPSDVRACFAAGRIANRLRDNGGRVGLVVRGPSPGGLGADDISDLLGLPVIARMRPQPGLARDLEAGRPPGTDPRGPLAKAAAAVLVEIGVDAA